jgi:hypothetical protein
VLEDPGAILHLARWAAAENAARSCPWERFGSPLVTACLLEERPVSSDLAHEAREASLGRDSSFERAVGRVRGGLGAGQPNIPLDEWINRLLDSDVLLQRLLASHGVPQQQLRMVMRGVRGEDKRLSPWRAAVIAEWSAIYIRCIRSSRNGRDRATGVDMTHAVYLARADYFITGDERGRELMEIVARRLPSRPAVIGLADLTGVRRLH